MEKTLPIGSRQEFLNKDLSVSLSAMIGYYVRATTWNDKLAKEDKFDNAVIDFNITSCYKKLELDFDVYTKADLQNSLNKLDTIISVCTDMRADLIKLYRVIKEGKAYSKELEKEK